MHVARRIAVIATFCLVLPASAALGASKQKASVPRSKASVTIAAPGKGHQGARISFRVVSVFTVAGNGAEHLTVFIAPPSASCPKTVRLPHGADSLLSGEPADRVLIANVLSDPLSKAGTWTVCGYLTAKSKITASARAHVRIS